MLAFAEMASQPVPGLVLLGRFRILREVAQGGMGVVYEALDEKLQRRVAIKIAKPGHDSRLPPEVRNASEISHPNVCRIFEIHSADGFDFITMEFLVGITLAERLGQGKIPEPEARVIALQLCAGLAEAHRNRLIHGDFKSQNIILTQGADGKTRAVITDFGLARPSDGPSECGGTPGYMAPELWSGSQPTVASDIYALGVVLYELIAGCRPHQTEIMQASTASLGATRPVPRYAQAEWQWSGAKLAPAHRKWDRVLAKCLETDPAKRYTDVRQIADALDPGRARRRLVIAGIAIAVAVVTGTVTYERATAPAESVVLGVSIDSPRQTEIQRRLSSIRNSAKTAFRVRNENPTHILRVTATDHEGKTSVQTILTDAKSQVNMAEWSGDYSASELKYAPAAVAGVVTRTFHLPPASEGSKVNSSAATDYREGIAFTRRDRDIDKAIASLRRAVTLDYDSALTHAGLAEATRRKYFLIREQKWLDEAVEEARKAEVRDPDCAETHRIMGLLEANKGKLETAIVRYQRAVELDSTNADAFRRLGEVYARRDQMAEALAAYKHAVAVEPNYYRSHQDLGAYYLRTGDYNQAIRAHAAAVAVAPEERSAHSALADSYMNVGRFIEAEHELRSLTGGGSPADYIRLGQVLMYQRRDREAIAVLERALTFGPSVSYVPLTYLGVCHLRLGEAQAAKRRFREGLDAARKEIARSPRLGRARPALAYLLARTGDVKGAEAETAQTLQLAGSSADTIWMAALTYSALGDFQRATDALKNAPILLLEDLQRWPEAQPLCKSKAFQKLLATR